MVGMTRVDSPVVMQVDITLMQTSAPSPIKCSATDPLLAETALCTPRPLISTSEARVHSIDVLPRGSCPTSCSCMGIVGAALDEEFKVCAGRVMALLHGPPDGSDVLCGFGQGSLHLEDEDWVLAHEVDICLSGTEECGSGLTSPT
jgi:hypothetical protein